MADKLTARNLFTGTIDATEDEVHIVDKNNYTDGPDGTSFRSKIYKLINSLFLVTNHVAASVVLSNVNCPIGRIPHFRLSDTVLRTITIPSDAVLTNAEIGYSFEFTQVDTGQVQILASGVTLISADGATITRTRYSSGRCEKVAANTWEISGDIL